ncbi:Kelch repeat-containing protein 3 [Pseudocercospora fuligena]|uniref:Kelch repeat-containing protein 3 n=1 Tax=Pseudocercospora fuligena TaxID=685502 RepID=A0A8H6RIC5_9PEZI|nr:Kelch repeat-containing protein 3 [Pseudocercospora fuligena]
MAKDKKDKRSAAAAKKAKKEASQAKKAEKTTKKATKKAKEDDSDVEDADLDAILAEYQKQQEQFLKVTEAPSEPPTPRSSATIVASPSNSTEVFLFGGEYYNGALATFFNDLYVYKINQDSWRKVTSPNSPLPRSGHAMCQGGNGGGIYMFGGEFSSPKQGTFYHYNDFWRLEPSTREWTKLEGKGGPPARSGHRMTYFKNYIILFGGFQDTSQQTKYLQDVWLYDTQKFTWHQPALPPASGKPDARSSFSFLPHETGAVIYGGYSRVKASASAGKAKGNKPGASRVIMKPMVHQDTWYLRITTPASDAPANTLPTVRWERRKRPVNAPNPPRAGATMAHHKGRGIVFGGVHDVEESEEGIDSEFFNLLYAYNIDRNRFFQLNLRTPRTSAKKIAPAAERGKRGRGKADEEELLRNLALIEGKGNFDDEDKANGVPSGDASDEEEPTKIEKPTMWEMPHPRFNAQLTVQEDTLYIYGGTYEKGDQEFTFDEMWAIDLAEIETEQETSSAEKDNLPMPRPFESLRDFFARSSNEWQNVILEAMKYERNPEERSVKEIRKRAFNRAEEKWWDAREEIQALEDEQEAAGVSEVVSLAERGDTGGAGRRR